MRVNSLQLTAASDLICLSGEMGLQCVLLFSENSKELHSGWTGTPATPVQSPLQ